jgi:PD-(D/E)XK nuclease superfamily
MHPLYLLKPPSGHPQPPDHWSYSSLKAWRECPRRWWLERCTYPNVEGKFYPAPVSAAALEGQLIHEVVEAWAKAIRRGENPGSMRLRFKLAIREAISALKNNARVDPARVAAAVSLDACVAKAYDFTRDLELLASYLQTPSGGGEKVVQEAPSGAEGAPSGAEEFWITVDDPPLRGQLDRVRNGVITDYKTGAPDAAHAKQVFFYAVLWWLKYSEVPQRLELRYPATVLSVPVPGPDELDEAAAALRAEIEDASGIFQSGRPAARPDTERCRYCPVRQLCDEYWKSPFTAELRLGGEAGLSQTHDTNKFGDVQLNQIQTDRRADGALFGEALADEIGTVRLRIGAHLCPAATETIARARILAVKMIAEDGGLVITTTTGTEAFWLK